MLIGWIAQTYRVHVAYAVAAAVPLAVAGVVAVLILREKTMRVMITWRTPLAPMRFEKR